MDWGIFKKWKIQDKAERGKEINFEGREAGIGMRKRKRKEEDQGEEDIERELEQVDGEKNGEILKSKEILKKQASK